MTNDQCYILIIPKHPPEIPKFSHIAIYMWLFVPKMTYYLCVEWDITHSRSHSACGYEPLFL